MWGRSGRQPKISKKSKNPSPYRLELISWLDSEGQPDHWAEVHEIAVSSLPVCQSVGWVISESDQVVTLAANWDPKNSHFSGAIAIPIVAITHRRKIRA